ncbi:MAG: hypothetical protein QXR97_01375, partial [Thermoproteota archaeon]
MPGEKCGLFGAKCFNNGCVFDLLYWGIIAQNHRGHESYGFLTYNKNFRRHVNIGLVPQISGRRYSRWRNFLQGAVGIAHVRYGTSGERGLSKLDFAQPLIASHDGEKIGFAFNGNIVNTYELLNRLTGQFRKDEAFCDAIVFSKYLVKNINSNGIMDAIEDCMRNVEGA